MNTNDGGPAFPSRGYSSSPGHYQMPDTGGMTLRDYFAAKALAIAPEHVEFQTDYRIRLAEWAYGMADAMLKVRKEQP